MKIKNLGYLALLLALTGEFANASSRGGRRGGGGKANVVGQQETATESVPVGATATAIREGSPLPTAPHDPLAQVVHTEEFKAFISELALKRKEGIKEFRQAINKLDKLLEEPTEETQNEASEALINIMHIISRSEGLFNEVTSRLANMHIEIQSKNQELELVEVKRRALSELGATLAGSTNEKDQKISELAQEMETLDAQKNLLSKQIEQINSEKETLERDLRKITNEKKELEGIVNRLQEENTRLIEGHAQNKTLIGELRTQLTDLQTNYTALQQADKDQKAQIALLDAALKEELTKNQKITANLGLVRGATRSLSERLKHLEESVYMLPASQ
ncbi:MAG: hypothetical protein Q8K36_04565 [Alphaproteobacteria bacterium]|nr:hypothetical protein [Alphaproteobacteria bacterium]